jgi:hypothetical protein
MLRINTLDAAIDAVRKIQSCMLFASISKKLENNECFLLIEYISITIPISYKMPRKCGFMPIQGF